MENNSEESMTKGEREELHRYLRRREKTLNNAAEQRAAELLADFENQMGSEYAFDDDAIWEQSNKIVEHEVEKANVQIATRCRELGIPKRFAPSISAGWHNCGENASKERRKELRVMATTR